MRQNEGFLKNKIGNLRGLRYRRKREFREKEGEKVGRGKEIIN